MPNVSVHQELTPQDIHTFHRATYGPSMRCVLPALTIDEEELSTVQAKVFASMVNKLGHYSTLPTEIFHGPLEMGGLALLDLRTEIGISQMKYLRDSIFSDSESGKLIIMSLKYSQIEAGISKHLLEHPSIHHTNMAHLCPPIPLPAFTLGHDH